MSNPVRVAVDAMGGDNAPGEIVRGAAQAVQESPDVKCILVGQQEKIQALLAPLDAPKDRIEVVDAREVIETGEAPVMAIRLV